MKLTLKIAFLAISVTLLVIAEVELGNLLIIGQLSEFNSKAIAQIVQDYIPPNDSNGRSRTKGAGSRGCNQNSNIDLQLLAPDNHIPTTISAHPTFFWYISSTSLPLRFTLIEPGVAKPVIDKRFLVTHPGIVGLKLPSDVSGLVINKQYRWTVSVMCDEERQSANTYAYGWIKRVAETTQLKSNLASSNIKPQERSLIYAHSGIWYEALLSGIAGYEADPLNKVPSRYLRRLLAQVGISSLADQQLQRGKIVRNY